MFHRPIASSFTKQIACIAPICSKTGAKFLAASAQWFGVLDGGGGSSFGFFGWFLPNLDQKFYKLKALDSQAYK